MIYPYRCGLSPKRCGRRYRTFIETTTHIAFGHRYMASQVVLLNREGSTKRPDDTRPATRIRSGRP